MVFFKKLPAARASEPGKDTTSTDTASLVCINSISSGKMLAKYGVTVLPDDVCDINHSPKRLFKFVSRGNLVELEKVLAAKPDLAHLTDHNGRGLLHHAAQSGKPLTMDFLVQKGCDVDAKDSDGNSPLHLAAIKNDVKAVHALIALKADLAAKNSMLDSPLHTACRFNSIDSLESLLNACGDGVHMLGWHGTTPLHTACVLDYLECMKLLLAHGGDLFRGCDSSRTPVHAAASRGSNKILTYLLTESEVSNGELVALLDDDERTPLHWAVNNANPETVKLLVEHGAELGTPMSDKATPLHMACSQGLLVIVEQMFNSAPCAAIKVLGERDEQGMTPLHMAAMFDHLPVVHLLLEKGAGINDQDCEGRTSLVLAASRGSWGVLKELLHSGADPKLVDKSGKNFLHYFICQRNAPEICESSGKFEQMSELLNMRDMWGCTPLHYAAQNGYLKSSDGLVKLGASVSAKDKDQQSPLHFATKYGRYNTVRRLLETSVGFNIINESDNYGLTPLHLAAENGHSNVVKLLMSKGALIHRDYQGRTPLHLAAKNDYRESVHFIASHYAHLVDSADKNGDTALHLAASTNSAKVATYLLTVGAKLVPNMNNQNAIDVAIQNKHQEVTTGMVLHERWEEVLTTPSSAYGWPVLGLIEHLPEVMTIALDRCITRAQSHPLSKDYSIHFDFKLLEPVGVHHMKARDSPDENESLKALNAMVRHGRSGLLSHSVCSSYLNNKWARYGAYIYGFNVALYTTFLSLFTYLIVEGVCQQLIPDLRGASALNVKKHSNSNNSGNNFDMEDPRMEEWMLKEAEEHGYQTSTVLVSAFAGLNVLKELFQVYNQRSEYFKDRTNFLEWALYVSTLIFTLGHCFLSESLSSMRWQLGAVAIFLAWFNFMLFLQRFGLMGVYVVMFLGVLKTLLRALFVFGFLLIAFSLAFYVLLPQLIYPDDKSYYQKPGLVIDISMLRTPHQTIMQSILRIISITIGDFDMVNNYINPLSDGTLPFPEMTYFFLLMFIVTVSLLLMNLLIGLAVGDIEKVQRSATLRRLGMQVGLHTGLEEKLPNWFLKRVTVREDTYYPNYGAGFLRRIFSLGTAPDVCADSGLVGGAATCTDVGQLQAEAAKQRKKLKEVQSKLDKQYDLLRLIVQKMEIGEEADQLDEGGKRSRDGDHSLATAKGSANAKWASRDVKLKFVNALTQLKSKK